MTAATMLAIGVVGCSGGKHTEDHSEADSLFQAVTSLTEEYTSKVATATDSAEWAAITSEYEDKLEKINFRLPADTDLMLTEGQNDTIFRLTEAYMAVRDARITAILHPVAPVDSLPNEDLVNVEDASRNPGN